jgi:hypothetical protein
MVKRKVGCQKRHTNSIPRSATKKLSVSQLKKLKYGDIVYLPANCGHLLNVRVSGKPQTWKTRPNEVKVPFKYGLYEYGYITHRDNAYRGK